MLVDLKILPTLFEIILDQILRLSTKPSWIWHSYQSFPGGVSRVKSFWDIGELKSDYKSLTPKLGQVLKRIQMSKNVTGVMVMNQDGMPVIMIIIFNILLYCFVSCFYISTLCSMFAFAMNQPHIGDRDHRFQHWSFWPSSYIAGCGLCFAYTLCSAGCFLLRG